MATDAAIMFSLAILAMVALSHLTKAVIKRAFWTNIAPALLEQRETMARFAIVTSATMIVAVAVLGYSSEAVANEMLIPR